MKLKVCWFVVVFLIGCSKSSPDDTIAESFIELWNSGQQEKLVSMCDSTIRIFDYDGSVYDGEDAPSLLRLAQENEDEVGLQ